MIVFDVRGPAESCVLERADPFSNEVEVIFLQVVVIRYLPTGMGAMVSLSEIFPIVMVGTTVTFP